MPLTYSMDDLHFSTCGENFLARLPLPAFAESLLLRILTRRYGTKDTLRRARILRRTGIRVGKYSYGYKHMLYTGSKLAEVGAFTSIAPDVKLSAGNHPLTYVTTHPFPYLNVFGFATASNSSDIKNNESITIGHDVWLGQSSVILTGVTIGHGAVVAAGAVVTKNVPPYAIVGGVPAKVLRYRFDEPTIAELLASEWWTWPDDQIRANLPLFQQPAQFVKLAPQSAGTSASQPRTPSARKSYKGKPRG